MEALNERVAAQPAAPAPARPRGRSATVREGEFVITVYPLGFVQMEDHADTITAALAALGGAAELLKPPPGASLQARARMLLAIVAPLLGKELLSLVSDCCEPRLRDLNPPHWMVGRIVEQWAILSFLSGGEIESWRVAADNLLNLATGKSLRMIWSQWFAPASPSTPSTAAPAETAPPMQDGAGPSSSASAEPSIEPMP